VITSSLLESACILKENAPLAEVKQGAARMRPDTRLWLVCYVLHMQAKTKSDPWRACLSWLCPKVLLLPQLINLGLAHVPVAQFSRAGKYSADLDVQSALFKPNPSAPPLRGSA
jgi:hypothetical protein